MLFKILLLFLIDNSVITKAEHVESFYEHQLVPDILSVTPTSVLKVTFPNDTEVLEGNILTRNQVAGMPKLSWVAADELLYTVVFCDADPPSRINPEARSFLHWLVVNIQGQDLETGSTLVTILNSNPEPGTGLHRYVFLVYQQREQFDIEQIMEFNETFEGRRNFSPDEFSTKYNLGLPVAGNFYQTENTEDI